MKKQTLKQQAANAPKYVLHAEGLGYVADADNISGIVFTEHKELAIHYSVGFDNPAMKIGIWEGEAKKVFGQKVGIEAIEA